MAEVFKRQTRRFVHKGINLVVPIDLAQEGQYPILTNVRSYFEGSLIARPGLTAIASLGTSVHSIKRLNDRIAATFNRFVGTGSSLLNSSGTSLATGFSGNPLTFVGVSPTRTPRPWLYVADASKMVKVRVGSTTAFNWGIASPSASPFVNYGVPAYTTISSVESTTGWTEGGTAGTITAPDRVNTTIDTIAYDTGSTGWASISPTDTADVNEGMLLILAAAETVLVQMVIPAIPTTTVASISYDSGSTGDCSVQLTANVGRNHLTKGSLITIGGEAVTVKEVIWGPDDIPCIRVTTTGTRAATNAVVGKACFRAYTTSTRASGNAVTSKMLQSDITAGIGFLTLTGAVDASMASSRPIDMENDEIHLSINISDLSLLTEAKLMFDIDKTTNDLTENYYVKSLQPNEFIPVTKDTATLLEAKLNRLQNKLKKAIQNDDFAKQERLRQRIANVEAKLTAADKTPLESLTTLGDNQWTELRFKIKDMLRVGSDISRTLANIAAVRVQVNVTDSVVLQLDSIWIGGTYGPDVGNHGEGYQHVYRYRSSETGATSAWSAISYTPINPHRERLTITPTTSSDGQVDKIDYARRGGVLPDWRMIGTGANSGTFNDDFPDDSLFEADVIDFSTFQPFPITDVPKTGTVNVSGVTIDKASGDAFATSWARGTIIVVNNIDYTIHSVLSTTKALLNENAGSQSGVAFYAPAPLLVGTPLMSVFGPIGYGETGIFVFGVGATLQAGTLFWTVGNDPDSCHDFSQLNVCPPSEPLVAGVVYNGRAFVLSTERMFEIFPNFSSEQVAFNVQPLPDSRGMLGLTQNTAICVGPKIWYRGKDGIYETTGGEPLNITDEQLYPLFPHDGQAGSTVNSYAPPDDTKPQHLEYYDGLVYYDYIDTNNSPNTLVYDPLLKRWSNDLYSTIKPLIHYGEEGSDVHSLLVGGDNGSGTGKLWQQIGTSDDSNAIAGHVRTGAFDAGDPRAKKLFGDTLIDADPDGTTLTLIIGFDNYATLESSQTQTGSGRAQKILEIQAGAGKLARNEALDIAWSSTTAVPKLYLYEPSFIIKPEDTQRRYTDPTNLGYQGAKFLQGVKIHADTENIAKSITIQYDAGTNGVFIDGPTISVQHNGECIIPYSFDPFSFTPTLIGHLFRLKTNDAITWRDFEIEWIWEPEPELTDNWVSQQTTHDLIGFQHIRYVRLPLLSSAQVDLTINIDGIDQTALAVTSTGGLRLKRFIQIPAKKGTEFIYKLAPHVAGNKFRVYQKDLEVAVKNWGSTAAYSILKPFGDISREFGGARI